MKKRGIDLALETFLLLIIFTHHNFDHLQTSPILAANVLLAATMICTLHRIFTDVFSLRIFYVALALVGFSLIALPHSEQLFTAGKFIQLWWQGYYSMKWVIVAIVVVQKYCFKKNEEVEMELLKGTRYLLKKNGNQ